MPNPMSSLDYMFSYLRGLAKDPQDILRLIDELEELLSKKGQDYSGETTPFENFHRTASMMDSDPSRAIRWQVAHKIGRLLNVVQRQHLHFEDEAESWRDLLGYIILLLAYLRSKEADE